MGTSEKKHGEGSVPTPENSYSRIIKSSSLIGGAQAINMLVGMVRVKFVAILIGPVGIGLQGTYQVVIQLVGTITGMGIQSSAVRDVADAVGVGDQERIGRTIISLRRLCWFTGSLGFLSVVFLSKMLSLITFNTTEHASAIAMLGLTILFTHIYGGQMALIQGLRRIGDLAKVNVLGTVSGSVVGVLLYAWLGMEGIVPAMLAMSTLQLGVSWWFARKISVSGVSMSWRESFQAVGGMVKLGSAFMLNNLMLIVVAYATRVLIGREINLLAVGIFVSAFSLSGTIANLVLGAMAADYYPSLTAVSRDHLKMRELVNEQTEIALLLALPGLLLVLSFAPWIMKILYSSEFSQAELLLRWFIVGCFGRVISWPMGFIVLAKGRARMFAIVETFFNVLHILMVWIMLDFFGIEGVAIAFVAIYILYSVGIFLVSRYLIGFHWSGRVANLLMIMFPVIIFAFGLCYFLSPIKAALLGCVITPVAFIFCLRGLVDRLGKGNSMVEKICRIPVVRLVCGL